MEINEKALAAANNERVREELIEENRQTILRMACLASHKYVSESDDEWSVALYAFSKAIDSYDAAKGDFLGYANVLIKRDLIDHFRKSSKFFPETSVSPEIMEGDGRSYDGEDALDPVAQEASKALLQSAKEPVISIADEIRAANEELKKYGFRFMDLTECSPKQEKTKRECAKAVRCVLGDDELLKKLKDSAQLPIRIVKERTGVSVKTLDRYRKYIIMAVVMLSGEYPAISSRLRFIRESTV